MNAEAYKVILYYSPCSIAQIVENSDSYSYLELIGDIYQLYNTLYTYENIGSIEI